MKCCLLIVNREPRDFISYILSISTQIIRKGKIQSLGHLEMWLHHTCFVKSVPQITHSACTQCTPKEFSLFSCIISFTFTFAVMFHTDVFDVFWCDIRKSLSFSRIVILFSSTYACIAYMEVWTSFTVRKIHAGDLGICTELLTQLTRGKIECHTGREWFLFSERCNVWSFIIES